MKRHPGVIATLVLVVGALTAAGCGTGNKDQASSPTPAPSASAAGGVLAKSLYDDGPRAAEQPVDAARAAVGENLFKTKGCSACHGFGVRLSCPDLKGVSSRRTVVWMQNQILHPDVMTKQDPISHGLMAVYALQMPKQGLTAEQADQVIEYLKHRDRTGK